VIPEISAVTQKESISVNQRTTGNGLWVGLGLFVLLLFLPFVLKRFYIYFLGLIFVNGLLAMSLNLVLGYGGIYQFHHAVFYGMGAYGTALMITKLGQSPWLGFVAGPLLAALLSLVMGVICIRLSKLYFGMLQISLGSLVWVIVYRWYEFTGGDDGIHGVPLPSLLASSRGSYYFALAVTAACLLVMYLMVRSPFGSTLQGIRDNPVRSAAVGVNVRRQQLTALVLAGFFAGVAGVLFVVIDNSAFPDMLFWTLSLEAIIMCLLGGWLTFLGPMLGAALLVALRTFASTFTEYWALIQGILLVLVIIFLPEGVLGYLETKWKRLGSIAFEEKKRG
jgi:branched-chain amino acid transport system permease protein